MLRKRLRKLSYKNFVVLVGVFISRPFLILPTYHATRKTIAICNEYFGKTHHGNTKSNAFRHALWNYLICANSYRSLNSIERAVAWSKKITHLHEDLAPNSEIAKAMDLHNNAIGRLFFAENIQFREDKIEKLRRMAKNALKIYSFEDIKAAENELVYIED